MQLGDQILVSIKLADVMREWRVHIGDCRNSQHSITVVAGVHAIANFELRFLNGWPGA